MRFGDFIGKKYVKFSEHDASLVRLSIMEELKATDDYIKRANLAENAAVREVFLHIAQEEKVHFGELEALLEKIDKEHEPAEDEAEDELEDMFGEEDD